MKSKIFAWITTCGVAALAIGCFTTVDGNLKTGVPFVNDKKTSRYQRPAEQVWSASKTVLSQMGKLTGENTLGKTLTATVDTRTAYVKIVEIDPHVSEVTVQVRTRARGADSDLAAEIDKRIALQLAVGR